MPESKKRPTAKKAPAKTAPKPPAKVLEVTSADEWMSSAGGQLIELPSGRVVRVRMPGMQAFIGADLIPNELMPIVMRAVSEAKPAEPEELKKLESDPEMLLKLALTMDKIFAYCVTEPQFTMTPTREVDGRVLYDNDAKVQGVLYTDAADDDDKGYIFNVAVGGTRDLERFRQEQAEELAALSAR